MPLAPSNALAFTITWLIEADFVLAISVCDTCLSICFFSSSAILCKTEANGSGGGSSGGTFADVGTLGDVAGVARMLRSMSVGSAIVGDGLDWYSANSMGPVAVAI